MQTENRPPGENACPSCASATRPTLSFRGFAVRTCAACELSYLHPQAVPRRSFDADYLLNLLRGQARSIEFFEREAQSLRRIVELRGARALDVGFGAGTFLGVLLREGAQAFGSEISEAACEHARRRFPGAVVFRRGTALASAALTAGSFDLVTFWDSLQYMPDPLAEIAAARHALKPGALLVLQVPRRDAQCLGYARALGWLHGDVARAFLHLPAALFLFSERSLRRALDRLGFDVLELRGHPASLRPRLGPSLKACVSGLANEGYALLTRLTGRRVPLIVYARKRAAHA